MVILNLLSGNSQIFISLGLVSRNFHIFNDWFLPLY
jgi:hypothetical protein